MSKLNIIKYCSIKKMLLSLIVCILIFIILFFSFNNIPMSIIIPWTRAIDWTGTAYLDTENWHNIQGQTPMFTTTSNITNNYINYGDIKVRVVGGQGNIITTTPITIPIGQSVDITLPTGEGHVMIQGLAIYEEGYYTISIN